MGIATTSKASPKISKSPNKSKAAISSSDDSDDDKLPTVSKLMSPTTSKSSPSKKSPKKDVIKVIGSTGSPMFSESEKALDTQREALINSIMNDSNSMFNDSLSKKKKKKSKKEKHEKTDEVAEDATTNHVITKESLTNDDLETTTMSAKKKKKKHKKEKYENEQEEVQGTKRKAEFSLDSPMVTTPVAKKAKKLSFDSSTPALLENSQNEAPSNFSFNLDSSASKEKKKKKKDKKEKKQNGDINE